MVAWGSEVRPPPVLVMVTVLLALLLPTAMAPKSIIVGATASAGVVVPIRLAEVAPPGLALTVRTPLLSPGLVGASSISMEHVPDGKSGAVQVLVMNQNSRW